MTLTLREVDSVIAVAEQRDAARAQVKKLTGQVHSLRHAVNQIATAAAPTGGIVLQGAIISQLRDLVRDADAALAEVAT